MVKRIGWDEFFMKQAELFSSRATCNRLKVGCVIVRGNQLLSEGYNGSVKGHPHCFDVGCLLNDEQRCIRCIHAEQNAVLNAMAKGVPIEGATLYVTHEPCEGCMRFINQAGIKRVVYKEPYKNKYNHHFSSGMLVEQYVQEG